MVSSSHHWFFLVSREKDKSQNRTLSLFQTRFSPNPKIRAEQTRYKGQPETLRMNSVSLREARPSSAGTIHPRLSVMERA